MKVRKWMKRMVILDLLMLGLLFLTHSGGDAAEIAAVYGNAAAGGMTRTDMADTEGTKRIALTFDDDVIIGLSQEISYKEAFSMI